MLKLTEQQQIDIDNISRSRLDGGLGVVFVDGNYLCQDVRNDPNYSEYAEILAVCSVYIEPIDAWQGRYVLAGMQPVAAGPLSAYPGSNVLEQINSFVAANLSAPEQERFRGTKTWRRDDPMVASLGALLGLDDTMIDTWFESARSVQ